ncbi:MULTISPECIES: hypothetical protein [Nocardiopsis]|uniref:hypothetical protein n=1 Tax=Nocardiopsis TaxID=2013 RepID=UPI0011800E7A|nr:MULTISPECIES: hypothetical protein [Nocardiopsis]
MESPARGVGVPVGAAPHRGGRARQARRTGLGSQEEAQRAIDYLKALIHLAEVRTRSRSRT